MSQRAAAVAKLLEQLTAPELAIVAVAWCARRAELAKHDPIAAKTLAAAMLDHLAAYRPDPRRQS